MGFFLLKTPPAPAAKRGGLLAIASYGLVTVI